MKVANKKQKIVSAWPTITLLSQIRIKDKDKSISIGGFTFNGGIYLDKGYKLVEDKIIYPFNKEAHYYIIVKDPKVKSRGEKILLTQANKEEKYKKERKKQLERELKELK